MFGFENTNEGQRKVVVAANGLILITAGPGAGKISILILDIIKKNLCCMKKAI